MAGTLDNLDMVAEQSRNSYGAPVVLTIVLAPWLIGMVLYSFVTAKGGFLGGELAKVYYGGLGLE